MIFSLTIRPFPNWGWVFASGIIGILLAFYLSASLRYGDLAAWCVDRDRAHLRRGRYQLPGVAGASELTVIFAA